MSNPWAYGLIEAIKVESPPRSSAFERFQAPTHEGGVPPVFLFAGSLLEATSQRSFSMEYALPTAATTPV
jgi:hypothetical protein